MLTRWSGRTDRGCFHFPSWLHDEGRRGDRTFLANMPHFISDLDWNLLSDYNISVFSCFLKSKKNLKQVKNKLAHIQDPSGFHQHDVIWGTVSENRYKMSVINSQLYYKNSPLIHLGNISLYFTIKSCECTDTWANSDRVWWIFKFKVGQLG